MPAQLDGAGQFAPVLVSTADRFGGWFINSKHAASYRRGPAIAEVNSCSGSEQPANLGHG
jgi:hypothetical protein